MRDKEGKTLSLNKKVDQLLKKNPKLREAMKVFNISSKEYKNAIKAISRKSVTTTVSTTSNGDMA